MTPATSLQKYEAQREEFEKALAEHAEDLRLGPHQAERYAGSIEQAVVQLGRLFREQFGTILAKQIDWESVRWILMDAAQTAGRAVSGARVDEYMDSSMKSHRTMLAALAAGGLAGSQNPESGKALHDLFGHMLELQPDEVQETALAQEES